MVCYITLFLKDVNPSRQCFMADTSPSSNKNPPSYPFCPAWAGKKITKGDNDSSLSEREAPPSKTTSIMPIKAVGLWRRTVGRGLELRG